MFRQVIFGSFRVPSSRLGKRFMADPTEVSAKILAVPTVRIDEEGVYKYIQIKIADQSKNREKILIRGFNYADYHADILGTVS